MESKESFAHVVVLRGGSCGDAPGRKRPCVAFSFSLIARLLPVVVAALRSSSVARKRETFFRAKNRRSMSTGGGRQSVSVLTKRRRGEQHENDSCA